MDGIGVYVMNNNERYEGRFKNNKKNGKGIYFW